MICQECADETEKHQSGFCLRCRDWKIKELEEQIKMLEGDA